MTISPKIRRQVWTRSDGRCSYCGCALAYDDSRSFDVDHITPLALGGTDHPENLTIACKHCNRSKGSRKRPRKTIPELSPRAKWIRALRDHLGGERWDLAEPLGIVPQTLSYWESDNPELTNDTWIKRLSAIARDHGFLEPFPPATGAQEEVRLTIHVRARNRAPDQVREWVRNGLEIKQKHFPFTFTIEETPHTDDPEPMPQ